MKCNECNEDKEEDEFYKQRKVCKKCVNKKRKIYVEENRDRINANTRKWKNQLSKEKKEKIKEDLRNRNKERYANPEIRSKELARQAKYREENLDDRKKQVERYDKSRKGKAKKKKWYWENRDKILKDKKQFYQKYKEKCSLYGKKWREENPEKQKAQWMAANARKTGKLIPSEVCEVCEVKTRLEMHHYDYSKPLDVIWCCRSCHGKLDRIRREAEF